MEGRRQLNGAAMMTAWFAVACGPVWSLAGATPKGLPEGLVHAPPNTWVRVASAPGPRRSFGLIYAPAEGAFVCLGGAMMMDLKMDPKAVDSPYSELTLNLEKGVWENRFPKGKEGLWGQATGPSKAPAFPGSYYAFKMKDVEGNVRPYLGAGYYNAMWLWDNWTSDTDRGRVVCYWTLANRITEYEVATRTWAVTTSAADLPGTFRDGMLFGTMCYDPVNKEVLGGQGEWAWRDGTWRRLDLGSALINGLRAKADALRIRAADLAGACRSRYYVAESAEEDTVNLTDVAAALGKDVAALAAALRSESAMAEPYEARQLTWATAALGTAVTEINQVARSIGSGAGSVTPETICDADAARGAMGQAVRSLAVAPPRRAHARMVYDAANRKVVLFGGDALDRLLADTWVYDPAVRRWQQRRSAVSPSPRAGYQLVYLPKSRTVLLIDGYGYKGSREMWVYDTKADTWQRLASARPARGVVPGRNWFPAPAAATDDDLVVTFLSEGRSATATYAARIDATRIDPEGTSGLGVPPLSETPHPGFWEDPQWYEANAPAPNPAATEAWLKDLAPNTWTMRVSPNWPKVQYRRSRCWGTCVLDTDRDQLLHFGGGHCTYDGNDVLHYSIRANRFFISHRPEHTLNFAPNGIGIPACISYQGRPFMSCHTYKVYAYDPTLRRMVFCATKTDDSAFSYDPATGRWALDLLTPFHRNGFNIKNWQTKCVSTPRGVVAWPVTGEGLWQVDAARSTWRRLPLTAKVGTAGWDVEGMAYDSRRDRLLLFASASKGDVTACDLTSGQVALLGPAGKERAAASYREAVYLPEWDAVLIGARPAKADEKPRWLLYDCGKNAWFAVHLPGADPLGKKRFNVSLGLMYDPRRKLVWAMDLLSRPYVLRLDLKTADLLAL